MSHASDAPSTIALIGNPNAGKTTLFNALTGANQRVGNYSGVTVELKSGETFTPHGKQAAGARSARLLLAAGDIRRMKKSPLDALNGELPGDAKPDLVVCVVDASNLERHLQLALQVIELGLPCVLALNMVDMAEKTGLRLDPAKLSEELGVPVVPMQANAEKGIVELKQALRFPLPARLRSHLGHRTRPIRKPHAATSSRELCELAARRPDAHQQTLSDELDAWLLHPVCGWVAFLAIMFAVFWAIFSFAEIPMGWIESGQGALGGWVESLMAEGDLRSLLVDGVIGGVGGVVVFLPQIVLLFLFIGLLESSGYMARAAFLMDGVMAKAGLSGKSFLPLFSSYACAIPGVMATRTIDSAKERLVTIFVAPWMSCSARLPVYFLIVPLLLHEKEGTWKQALVLFAIYALGTLTAFVVARMLRGKLGPDISREPFPAGTAALPRAAVELYLPPRARTRLVLRRKRREPSSSAFPSCSGRSAPIRNPTATTTRKPLSHSAMGRIGAVIEPVVKPLGFDGRIGTAILTSFAAREVFISSMAHDFPRRGSRRRGGNPQRAARPDSPPPPGRTARPLFTPLSLVSLLVFFIYALQCLPTSAVVARESGSWKWAVGQFVFMTGFAYVASLIVFQGGKLLGF